MLKKVSKSVTYTNFFNIHIDYTQGGSDVIKQKEKVLAYLEHISAFSILLAYDRLECPVASLSGASRPPRGLG